MKDEEDTNNTDNGFGSSNETKIYSYPDEKGIPAYAVFWEFRFIVFANNKCLFIFGAASD